MKKLSYGTGILVTILVLIMLLIRVLTPYEQKEFRVREDLMPWSNILDYVQCDYEYNRYDSGYQYCHTFDPSTRYEFYIYYDKANNRIAKLSVDTSGSKLTVGDLVQMWGAPDRVYDWNMSLDVYTICWINKGVYVNGLLAKTPALIVIFDAFPISDCYKKGSAPWYGFTGKFRPQ